MKKFNLLWLLGIFVIIGCTEEETFPEETNETLNRQIFVKINGEVKSFDLDDFDNTNGNTTILNKNNGNSSHAHGSYETLDVPGVAHFSVTENNGGVHGTITYTEFNDLGEDEILHMDTTCVYMLGNGDVIFAGTSTSVENDIPGNALEVGYTYFFRAIDNGQGKQADSDQAYGFVIFAPFPDFNICDDPELEGFFDLIAFVFGPDQGFGVLFGDIGNNSANMQSPYGVKVN